MQHQHQLVIRKQRYANVIKDVTPTPEGTKLAIRLQRFSFSVRVTSVPPRRYDHGRRQARRRHPDDDQAAAFETSTITLGKDGFTPETERLTVKVNNQAYSVALKKGTTPKHSR